MRKIPLLPFLTGTCLILSACGLGAAAYTCTHRLGCITVAPNKAIKIEADLTLTTPNRPYGIDALRGVEIAISDKAGLLGRRVELVKDDLCGDDGGATTATHLAAYSQVVTARRLTLKSSRS